VEFCHHESPLGRLLLAREGSALRLIRFPSEGDSFRPDPGWRERAEAFGDVTGQLDAYFNGERQRFDLFLAPHGTPFQERVWRGLLDIPYGATISYAELAHRIGLPRAVRAVGSANGSNPLPIVIPCHRVIGADGTLTGYGGGGAGVAGVAIKAHLLALEAGARRLFE
jgi:methylated-DNA-[protein]-cysteine S-methyltransferase